MAAAAESTSGAALARPEARTGGVLLPLDAELAARVAAFVRLDPAVLAWRPLDPLAPTGLALPPDAPPALTDPLAARGWRPTPLVPGPAALGVPPEAVPAAVVPWAPCEAARVLEAAGLPLDPAAATERALAALADPAHAHARDALARAFAQDDALALGDLLELVPLADGPGAGPLRALARARGAAVDRARLGDLVVLLAHDDVDPGVTPLARAALGAALRAALAPEVPATFEGAPALEDALAAGALADARARLGLDAGAAAASVAPGPALAAGPSGDAGAGEPALPGPFDPPRRLAPGPALEAALALVRAPEPAGAAPDAPGPGGSALGRLLRTLAAFGRRGPDALEAAVRLGREPALDDDGRLALVAGDLVAGVPADARRRRARRLAAGQALPARWRAVPDLEPLAAVIERARATAPGPTGAGRDRALAQVRARLDELGREPRDVAQGELAEVRAALAAWQAAEPAGPAAALDLALALAEGAPDAHLRARGVVAAWLEAARLGHADPVDALAPALEALRRAGEEPAPATTDDPHALALLCHAHALARRAGREPPDAFVARLVERAPGRLALTDRARQVDPGAVGALLGAALPVEHALELAAGLAPERLLLVAARGADAWDAVQGGAGLVVRLLEADGPDDPDLAALVRPPLPGLEAPVRAVGPEALGLEAGRWGLVGPRAAGPHAAPGPALVVEVARLLGRLHQQGLVLGDDPLACARRGPDGALALRGLDPQASLDPTRRADGQRRDVARLAARAAAWTDAPPPEAELEHAAALEVWFERARRPDAEPALPPDAELEAWVEDALALGPVTLEAVAQGAPPGLCAGPKDARAALLAVREALAFRGRGEVVCAPAGAGAPAGEAPAWTWRRPARGGPPPAPAPVAWAAPGPGAPGPGAGPRLELLRVERAPGLVAGAVRARGAAPGPRAPLVVVLDASGSLAGAPLARAHALARALVERARLTADPATGRLAPPAAARPAPGASARVAARGAPTGRPVAVVAAGGAGALVLPFGAGEDGPAGQDPGAQGAPGPSAGAQAQAALAPLARVVARVDARTASLARALELARLELRRLGAELAQADVLVLSDGAFDADDAAAWAATRAAAGRARVVLVPSRHTPADAPWLAGDAAVRPADDATPAATAAALLGDGPAAGRALRVELPHAPRRWAVWADGALDVGPPAASPALELLPGATAVFLARAWPAGGRAALVEGGHRAVERGLDDAPADAPADAPVEVADPALAAALEALAPW